MLTFPNAKINLGLKVLRKREDGFHDIISCMYPIALHDILEIQKSKISAFQFTGINIDAPLESNLCYKAYESLNSRYSLGPISLHLHKLIPHGAGIGGGSADAAFVLTSLNEIFELRLSNSQLEEIAAEIGSDCPFFINNKASLSEGRGEILNELELDLRGYGICIIKPDEHISTKEAYAAINPRDFPREDFVALINAGPKEWKNRLNNDFQEVMEMKFPKLKDITGQLYNCGAIYAAMSGSGSAYFGIFPNPSFQLEGISEDYFIWTGELG